MHFRFALVVRFLFAAAVLADRRRVHRQSGLLNRVEQSVNAAADGGVYSSNWAGAVLEKDPGTLTSVRGTFTLPVPSGKIGTAACAWVGIDGGTCGANAGLFQAGVDFGVTQDGTYYAAWYEWYPDYSYYFSDLSVSHGDVIKVNITALSTTSGIAWVENLTKGQSAHARVNSTYPICGQNAEWIVEDFEDADGNMVPFADFHMVNFTDTVAAGHNRIYKLDGTTIIDIEQNNQILTSTSINGSSLVVKYV